jgi:hypothetical protein
LSDCRLFELLEEPVKMHEPPAANRRALSAVKMAALLALVVRYFRR